MRKSVIALLALGLIVSSTTLQPAALIVQPETTGRPTHSLHPTKMADTPRAVRERQRPYATSRQRLKSVMALGLLLGARPTG